MGMHVSETFLMRLEVTWLINGGLGFALGTRIAMRAEPGFSPWVGKTPLEEGIGTHSSIFAWRILRTEEPSGLQSMGSQRVRHN